MKVYISGPITGHDNYMEEFEKGERAARAMLGDDIEIINPAKVNASLPDSTTWKQYMIIYYDLLNMADAIYMLPGWKKSTGACIEYGYAEATCKLIFDSDDEREERTSWG